MVEELLVPWWKILIYVLFATFSVAAIRFTIKLDLNELLKRRRRAKLLNEIGKRSDRCRHGWILYPHSTYSQCSICQAWINTGVLLMAKSIGDKDLIIIAERPGINVDLKDEHIIVVDYVGKKPQND